MINNFLELLKSDHATLINFKPISSHFLKIIFNIAISQSRWVKVDLNYIKPLMLTAFNQLCLLIRI